MVNTSGILRNRFRVVSELIRDPRGFTYDYHRLPFNDADNGTAVKVGSYWDTENSAALDKYNIPEISGHLIYHFSRSSQARGDEWLQAGIGDNQDLQLSGIEYQSDGSWAPIIKSSPWFDLEQEAYLYNNDCIEFIISGNDRVELLDQKVKQYTPISMATYYVDKWTRARQYETFEHRHSFTSTDSSEETLLPISGTEPTLYEPRVSGVRWQYVNSGLDEVIYDPEAPALIRSKNIISGVSATLQKVPWSQTKYQLPLIPAINISGIINYFVNDDYVEINNSIATLKVQGSGSVNWVYFCSGEYTRLSGTIHPSPSTIPVNSGSVASWPTSGGFLVDGGDGAITYGEYTGKSASGLSGINVIYNDRVQHDQAKLWYAYSGSYAGTSGFADAPIVSGALTAYYSISGGMDYTLNQKTGILEIPQVSGTGRVIADLDYYRGILVSYQPSGSTLYYQPSGLDVNLLRAGSSHGIIWAGMFDVKPARITLSTSRGTNSDGVVGPIYAGNDYLVITAKVLGRQNAPVPNTIVYLTFDKIGNAGLVDGVEPSLQNTSKTTDGAGEARFIYTPPDTINGLGYFVSAGAGVINSSGIRLGEEVQLKELFTSGDTWNTLLYAVHNDDYYLDYTTTSGFFTYDADGRFELITEISGQNSLGQNIWQPLRPVEALDVNGNTIDTTSGLLSGVYTLVYPSGSLPTDTSIGAYFVSANKQIRIGAATEDGFAVAPSFTTQISIPPFMTGEFLWGPVDDPDTKAFDSLSYLTINPYTNIDPSRDRTDPRALGNVFRVLASNVQTYLRNKFYVGVDIEKLYNTSSGRNTLRKLYTFRNRFIVEVE